jgi:hypothetical protein
MVRQGWPIWAVLSSEKIHLAGHDLILTVESGWVLARRGGPAQEHLRPAVGNVICSEVSLMDAASVDVLPILRSRRFVQCLLLGPSVLDDILHKVDGRIAASVRWKNCGWSIQVAKVESIVGVASHVHNNEGEMTRRVEHVDVHVVAGQEEGSGGRRDHAIGPTTIDPVFILQGS